MSLSVSQPGMFTLHRPQHDGSTSRGTPRNLGPKWPTSVDLSIVDIWSQIEAEWLQIAQWSQWRPLYGDHRYVNHLYSFEWYHRWPPTTPSPKLGVPYAPMILEWPSPQLVIWYTSCSVLEYGFQGRAPILYSTYCAVVFAIAQLSCFVCNSSRFRSFSHCNFNFYIVFVSHIVIILVFVLTERSAIILVFVFVTKIALMRSS